MKKQMTAVAVLALVAGTAMAAPRESQSYPTPVNSNPPASAESFTLAFTGSDGGGAYMATRVLINGTLTPVNPGTYASEAVMDVTPPGGAAFTIQLSPLAGTFVSETINANGAIGSAVAPAGNWTFVLRETYDDGGDGATDAVLSDIVVTLDDSAINPGESQSSAIDLGTLVDGTNVSAEAVVDPASFRWFKFVTDDCSVAAGRKLSVGTLNSTMGGDSEIAIYVQDGTAGWTNDDSGGLYSFLSFGVNSNIGVDLPAGEKFLVVGSYNSNFFLGFTVNSTGPGGTFQLDVLQEFLGAPTAPESEDLGVLVDNVAVNRDITLGAGEVKWYKATVGDVSEASGRHLLVSTLDTVAATDTEIGVYDSTGALMASNDDNPYPRSLLTFGYQGTSGDLAAGLYYIPVSTFNTNFLGGWNVASTGAGGEVHLTVQQITSFPPVGVALIAASGAGQLLTVQVTPGTNPASTSIVVTADLSETGGSATAALNDSGANGDVSAGDGIYSLFVANPAGSTDGQTYNINWTVADAQSRSDTGAVAFSVDTNNSLATAIMPEGSGTLDTLTTTMEYAGDADVFMIEICDSASFSATTVGGTTADTQLFLFDSNGMGVTFNDDSTGLQSSLTSAFIPGNGTYYLAVTRYDVDPVDSTGQMLWLDTPFATERTPDGPGASNAMAGWQGANFGTADITVTLTGACVPTGGPCSIADVGVAGGGPGSDNLLDNNDFIAFINFFFASNPIADMGIAGGLPGSDNTWDNNDFIAFINHFFEDSAACNG